MASLLDSLRAHLRPTDDDHRVTTLELLFDLVFVYAITNVTGLMEHDIGGETVLEGLTILAVVWFGWCAYTWLGNQAQADEGLLRVAMVVAMGGMFFVAISIPHAFEDEGNAAVVLAVAYAVVRFTHLGVYLIAAGDDTELRSVIFGMLGVATVMLVLLFTGAAVGGAAQQWWWLAAVVDRPARCLLRALDAMATQQRVALRRALRADHHHRHRRVDRRGRCCHVERRAERARCPRPGVRSGHRRVPVVALLRRRRQGRRGCPAPVLGDRAGAACPRLVHVRPLPASSPASCSSPSVSSS